MSRIDELKKQHPVYALSAIDIYKMVSPGQSNKYIEMLIKLDKNEPPKYRDEHRSEIIQIMVGWGIDYNYLETFDLETLSFVFDSLSNLMAPSRVFAFTKFASFIERKLIENTDVTSYSSWDEIEQAVSLAEVKLIDKALEKQIKKVYEDDTWLSLRPLSLEASMKYGANTKWCTTTNTGQYYARYSSRGILIYNINKKTGYKVACFKNLDSNYDNEFSWWDVTDRRIEALDSEAPAAVLEAIRNEIKTTSVANKMLMTKAEADKLELYQSGNYRPGMYENGPDLDRAYISGGIVDHVESSGTTLNWNSSSTPLTGTGTIYTYNPQTFTVNSTSNVGIGLGTSTPTAQIQVHGDLEIRNGNIRLTSDGVERGRITSGGDHIIYGPNGERYVNGLLDPQPVLTEDNIQQIYNELSEINEDNRRIAADAQQRLDDAMAEQLEAANERVVEERRSFLENIELGTIDQQLVERMQRLAGIETREMRIKRTEAELEQLRAEINRETEIATELESQRKFLKHDICSSVYEAEQPVVHLSLWNKIKNTGKKLSRTFTNRSKKQIGVQMKNESVSRGVVNRKRAWW